MLSKGIFENHINDLYDDISHAKTYSDRKENHSKSILNCIFFKNIWLINDFL